MTYLLAKVKRKATFLKVLSSDDDIYTYSDDDIYKLPTLDNSIEYNPATLLEEEQWYKYEKFSTSKYIIDFLTNDFDSVNYSQIDRDSLNKLSYICSVQGEVYYFQIISSSLVIRGKWFSLDVLEIETNRPIITINKYADVIYDKTNDVVYFKKLTNANFIFKGMDQLYRQATETEIITFLSSDFLSLKNDFNAQSVNVPNRKRIALVMDTFNKYTDAKKKQILAYIQGYDLVPFVNNSFEIETEENLKLILYGLEQRLFTTEIDKEQKIANSTIAIPVRV
jgi:hypothetical protein